MSEVIPPSLVVILNSIAIAISNTTEDHIRETVVRRMAYVMHCTVGRLFRNIEGSVAQTGAHLLGRLLAGLV